MPPLVVGTLSFKPVPFCSICTLASGTTAPLLSSTVPDMPPRDVWPTASADKSKENTTTQVHDLRVENMTISFAKPADSMNHADARFEGPRGVSADYMFMLSASQATPRLG